MSEFMMPTTESIAEFFADIADEMVNVFNISRTEAVARINAHWSGQQFTSDDNIVLHEDDTYWAMIIYYQDVPTWDPNADRSAWRPVEPPPRNSPYWTV
jgi:hypothetical protein